MHRTLRAAPVAASAVALVALVGCSPADLADAETGADVMSVTIQIDGGAVPYYAPIYEAVEQGYFADHGLDVELTYAEGAGILQNVAAGNVDFGFPNGDSVVTAAANGVDVQVVHTTYQQGIGALLFDAETSGITEPADLAGMRVAVTDLGSPNYIQLQAMLESAGLTVDDVEIVTVGSGAIVQALQNGEVDAIAFSRLRYFALEAAGFPVGQILSEDYLPSFGNVLVTSPAFRDEHPEAVAGFVAALDEGLQHVIDDPAGSIEEIVPAYAETFVGQEADITRVIEEVFIPDLWTSDATDEHGLGYGDLDRWQEAIDRQVAAGIVDAPVDAAALVVQPSDL